jgi:dGTPase
MHLYTDNDKEREIKVKKDELKKSERCRTPYRRDYGRIIHSASFRRLQGKTQLFPGIEADYFRNRITHSLEVAQIAKSIAIFLNESSSFFNRDGYRIDTDIVEIAGLAHDLGHPPFGHNGEKALNDCMKLYGGFEGNAQTLRILSKLEKKELFEEIEFGVSEKGEDFRKGLNLTYRSLASILKYDTAIPERIRSKGDVIKGYYKSDKQLVDRIKEMVTGEKNIKKFKTIECQIMDIADDIANATYDIEDAFKANFITPYDLINPHDEFLLDQVRKKVYKAINVSLSTEEILELMFEIFEENLARIIDRTSHLLKLGDRKSAMPLIMGVYHMFKNLVNDGYTRTYFTSSLISNFINGVKVGGNDRFPPLSKIKLEREIGTKVQLLKQFTYVLLINSPRLKTTQFRGYDIVTEIFNTLNKPGGSDLLPRDFGLIYSYFQKKSEKKRVICDFISGMTDRYALEFYGRIKGVDPESIFKPI